MGKEQFSASCTLCLLQEKEVAPFLKQFELQGVQISLHPSYGSLRIVFSHDRPLQPLIEQVEKRFPTYFLGEKTIEEAIHKEMSQRQKTVGLAESCTGGAIAARLVTVPGASDFFSGSIVAYSKDWKERFLGLKRDVLIQSGAVSLEAVKAMVEALFSETNIDYAVAVSGWAGPSKGIDPKSIGTVYIAVGKRGEKMDAGRIISPLDRAGTIELTLQTALSALWRRVAHNALTLS